MKSYLAHYKNKYPGGRVDCSDDRLDAYDADGNHRVSLRMGGNGQLVDQSAQVGALDCHDLSPIPKNARVYKHYPAKDGEKEKVAPSEEASDRLKIATKIQVDGKVLSIEEYKSSKYGAEFDQVGNLIIPKAASRPAPSAQEDLGEL